MILSSKIFILFGFIISINLNALANKQPNWPKTIEAEDFGTDGAAINAAIQAANPGDTVFISQGEWRIENQTIQAKTGVSIEGAGIYLTKLIHVTSTEGIEHPLINIDNTSDITISNLDLDANNNPLCTHGIDGESVSRITITSLRIQNLVQSTEFGSFGVFFNTNANHCSVHDCEFFNIGINSEFGAAVKVSQAESVEPSSHISITHNYIENTGRGGILMQNTQFATIKDNVVLGSGSSGIDGLGIELFNRCDFSVIEGNEVDHWISINRGNYIAIRGNIVLDYAADGIEFAGIEIAGDSAHCIVADNFVGEGNQVGLSISDEGVKDNILVVKNAFISSAALGAQIQGDTGGVQRLFIHQNVFELTQNNDSSFIDDAGHGVRINGNVSQVVFDDNEFSSNQGAGIQIRTDDPIELPVDQLTFQGNLILYNEGPAVYLAPDLLPVVNHVLWTATNALFGNTDDSALSEIGFTTNEDAPRIKIRSRRRAYVDQLVNFSYHARDNNDVSQILWDLGAGHSATDTNPKVSYSEPGHYTVRLVAWDSEGRATIEERHIEIIERRQRHSRHQPPRAY